MQHLFRKAFVAQRFSESEFADLKEQLLSLKEALQQNITIDPIRVDAPICSLFLYGRQGDQHLTEVLEFVDAIVAEDFNHVWSDNIAQLTSALYAETQISRVGNILERINEQKSLTTAQHAHELVSSLNDARLSGLYENKVDELNIDFTVQILPFALEVLDPRIVRVAPYKANELHRHAHETVFIFLEGQGKVVVDSFENPVKPGDFAFIPRWCNHQSINTGDTDLVFLAVADFGLTGKSFVGNYLKTARLKAQ
ncbi:MAG: cupin domain-containing protein [Flavobacteriales bacterium]|jgi:mannose-6-phosphate isomerase-like protein (cupin superfamily)